MIDMLDSSLFDRFFAIFSQYSVSLLSYAKAKCQPDKLIPDFGDGEFVYFNDHFMEQNDDTIISYWAELHGVTRTTWVSASQDELYE